MVNQLVFPAVKHGHAAILLLQFFDQQLLIVLLLALLPLQIHLLHPCTATGVCLLSSHRLVHVRLAHRHVVATTLNALPSLL